MCTLIKEREHWIVKMCQEQVQYVTLLLVFKNEHYIHSSLCLILVTTV